MTVRSKPCVIFHQLVSFKIIEDRFGVRFEQSESFKPVYSASAFTFPLLPVITNEDPEHAVMMQWGLIPFWAKDYQSAFNLREKTLNARAETLYEKPAFKYSVQCKRCLVPADGFFEWRHVNNKTYPYYIRLTNQAPFAFAGLWDCWTDPESERIHTFSIITTRANSLLEKIHNAKKRMPVILPPEKEKLWLQDWLDKETAQSILQPYNADEMEAYPVSRMVSKLGLNTTNPEVISREDYPELPELQEAIS